MSTSFGCVTVVGAITATMTLCTGDATAAAPIPCYASTNGTTATDNVANYKAACSTTPGPVCFQSISQAMACARYTMGSLQGSFTNIAVTETLTVGTHTTPQIFDLTVDDGTGVAPLDDVFKFGTNALDLYPAFIQMTGASPVKATCLGTVGGVPAPSSCLIVTGPGPSTNTTLVTNENFNTFSGEQVSHVVVEHMTIRQYPETILNSQFVSSTTTTLTEGTNTGTFYAVKINNVVGSNHFIEGVNHFAAISPSSNSVS